MRFMAKKKSPEGRNAYRTLRREYKIAIANAKDDGWKKFTSKINNPSEKEQGWCPHLWFHTQLDHS